MDDNDKIEIDPADLETLQEILTKKAELHEDLKPYVLEAQGLGLCLRHPLVYGVPYFEQQNNMYNEQYEAKCRYKKKALADKEWGNYVFIHEKPYRVEALFDLENDHGDEISDADFWEIFGEVWTNIENMWQMEDHIRMILEMAAYRGRDDQDAMMDEREHELLKALPQKFIVYRGHQGMNEEGLSWTLSPWRAQWFANRWSNDAEVTRGVLRKEHIVGIFLGRSEMEVGVLPEYLESRDDLWAVERPPIVEKMRDIAEKEFKLEHRSYHGFWHWDNVERNVAALCEKIPEADPLVCQLFANLHDCCRLDEDQDAEHGIRAANFIKELQLPLTTEQFVKLFTAIIKHNVGETTEDPTIGVCWDADRMDLPRVNIIPDPKYFSTEAAGELMWRV